MKKNAKPHEVIITAQAQLLTVKLPIYQPGHRGGRRGVIGDFSPASRKRMLELLARIDFDRAGFTSFVTLTYPDRDGAPTPQQTDRDRDRFFKRIRRQFPNASGIWRREWEARKSGDFVGAVYPHYHILFFNLPFVHYNDLNDWWRGVLRYDGSDLRTEIKGLKDKHHARVYLSKYIAKVRRSEIASETPDGDFPAAEDGDDGSPERRVTGADVDGFGGGEGGCSLVYNAYLTPNQNEAYASPPTGTGRHWGKFNRNHIPLGTLKTLRAEPGMWLVPMREAAGQIYAPAGERDGGSFTLFVDDAAQWLEIIGELIEGRRDDSP